jgi:hypothetical protein
MNGMSSGMSSGRLGGLVPISLLHPPNASTNLILPMERLEGNMLPAVRAHLRQLEVDHALQRPLTVWMRLATLRALISNGACLSKCYAKSARIDLFLPKLLRLLKPPRLKTVGGQTLPLAEANLWLGANADDSTPVLTDLHKDARPNVLAVLRGRKEVLLLPPSDEANLRPATLLDVSSKPATGTDQLGREEEAEVDEVLRASAEPQLPERIEDVQLDRQHYLADARTVRTEQLRPVQLASVRSSLADASDAPRTVCSFTVEAPDAIYIPPGYAHAVESYSSASGGTEASRDGFEAMAMAVNFFYDVPHDLVCSVLGNGNHAYMGREVRC